PRQAGADEKDLGGVQQESGGRTLDCWRSVRLRARKLIVWEPTKPRLSMTAPTSRQLRVDPLPRDNFRSILAGLITALTIGGWIDALGKTRMRGALAAQTKLWWIEQIVGV